MKRTPMRRTAFKSRRKPEAPAVEREPHPVAFTVRPLVRGVYGSAVTVAEPKRVYIRSKALLAAVRTLPCMYSGRVGATEPAHSNWPQHGKAKSIKADDNRVAALHRDVHRELDQGKNWTAEERQTIWWSAHRATVQALVSQGRWPVGVPVPQLEDFWA